MGGTRWGAPDHGLLAKKGNSGTGSVLQLTIAFFASLIELYGFTPYEFTNLGSAFGFLITTGNHMGTNLGKP